MGVFDFFQSFRTHSEKSRLWAVRKWSKNAIFEKIFQIWAVCANTRKLYVLSFWGVFLYYFLKKGLPLKKTRLGGGWPTMRMVAGWDHPPNHRSQPREVGRGWEGYQPTPRATCVLLRSYSFPAVAPGLLNVLLRRGPVACGRPEGRSFLLAHRHIIGTGSGSSSSSSSSSSRSRSSSILATNRMYLHIYIHAAAAVCCRWV